MFNPNKTNPWPPEDKKEPDAELVTRFNKKLEGEPNLRFLESLFKELPKMELYLVGGMVRDTIIKHPTSKDFDFIARGVAWDELVHTLQKFGHVDCVGRNFGVIKFMPHDSTLREAIDIALPRVEFAEGTGGSRDVEAQSDPNLTVAEDLSRRDLTINAMAWDMRKHELLDPFNGQADLNTGFIRCVGKPEARFQEDYSRILRAMRFACRFDFQIEEQTWSALTKIMTKINNIRDVKVVDVIRRKIALCKKPAEKEKLQAHLAEQTMSDPNQTMAEYIVPRETAAQELLKTLKENPARALELWDESGALKAFLPETLKMKGCEQPAQFHSEGDVWKHTMMMLQKINSKEFREYFKGAHITGEFVLGVLLHDAGKPPTKKTPEADGTNRIRFDGHDQVSATIAGEVANRLSLSKEQKELLKFMTSEHMVPMSAKDMFQMSANKFARRFIDSPYSTELLMLFYLDSVCSVRADGADTLQNFRDTLKRIEEINQNRAKWSKEKRKKITNGDTVIKTLQIKSGCFVGCVLELLAELADSGRLASEEEAIRFLEMNKGAIVDFEKNAKPENRGEIAEKMIKQFDQN